METTMKPPTPTTPRRLTRSRSDRMLGGVAGGIAQTYGFDPALVRLAFVVLALATLGTGAIAYVVAWLVVPEADADEPVLISAVRDARGRPHDGRLWIGLALVLVGAVTLANRFELGGATRMVWPLLLIGGGAAVLLFRDRHDSPGSDGPGPDHSVDAPPTPFAPPSSPAPTAPPAGSEPAEISDPAEPTDQHASAGPVGQGPPSSAYPPSLPWPQPPRPRMPRVARRRERSMLGRFAWSALLIVAGAAWLTDLTGAAAVDARLVLAIELGIVGVALLVGAWFGRSRGLIALGIVLAFFAGTFAALDVPLRGGIGENIVRPRTIGGLDHSYRLAIGHLEIDLRDTKFDDGKTRRIVLNDAIGFIDVFVPADANVEVTARSDIGSLDVLGRPQVGGTHAHTTVVDDPAGASGPRIVIDAHVGFGAVKVTRGQRALEVAR
jgi:phage shock protein PspC (stress-responsive transcriptional regulator)